MPEVTVTAPLPPDDLLRSVFGFSMIRYKIYSCINFLFLVGALGILILVLWAVLFGDSTTADKIVKNIWPLLGLGGSSGGIGAYLRKLEQLEQVNLTHQHALSLIGQLSDKAKKDKAILDYIKTSSAAAARGAGSKA